MIIPPNVNPPYWRFTGRYALVTCKISNVCVVQSAYPQVADHFIVVGIKRLVDQWKLVTAETTINTQQVRKLQTHRHARI